MLIVGGLLFDSQTLLRFTLKGSLATGDAYCSLHIPLYWKCCATPVMALYILQKQ